MDTDNYSKKTPYKKSLHGDFNINLPPTSTPKALKCSYINHGEQIGFFNLKSS